MVSFIGFIFIYVLGGITFLPLLGLLAFIYIKGGIEPILPVNKEETEQVEISKDPDNAIVKKGWIRVINQYQPKMPDLTHTNNGIISGIQSFTSGSSNSSHGESKYKKGVVYGVLKHDTLFCFESEKQKEMVMILPMQDYQVSLFAPAFEEKLDGEIYSRTTVIRLVPNGYNHDINLTSTKSATTASLDSVCTLPEEDITCHPSRILYLTCARNIDKEDWYFGLLAAHQVLHDNPKEGPYYAMMDTTRFDQKALEKLMRQVQSNPNQRDMSWLNAMIGRIFLANYKTDQLKTLFETKIRKKIDKTKRPTFLDEIHVRSVDVGDSAPIITNPKLLSLSTDGEVIVEAKVDYSGGLTIEIETDFNWSYSSRMKPIRMHLILAVALKKLQGRMMFKIKAPPTNRCWFAFFEMPEMEWKITPVVADKQIKLNIVTNAIESRIREVMMETFVLPNMNDLSFSKSNGKGGIFGEYKKVQVKRTSSEGVGESMKSQRSDSIQSTSSTSSNKSTEPHQQHRSSGIRETPTVPETVEKTHASDTLKLKNRGAESVSNLLIATEQDKPLVPPRTLEASQSTPDMQPTNQPAPSQPNHQPPLLENQPIGSSSSSSSKWSTGSYLRRRSKALPTEDSDHSDTESIKSNHSNRFLSKFHSLLPSEPSSDAMSIRSTTTTSKKQAILNMAENFLTNKRNSRHEEQEQEQQQSPVSESKKEIYAQRMANMRKRVEEKIGSSAFPPTKPRRGRANTLGNDQKPPLPPRKHSLVQEPAVIQEGEEKVESDDVEKRSTEEVIIPKVATAPRPTSVSEEEKAEVEQTVGEDEEVVSKVITTPPLPTVPRPKSVTLETMKQTVDEDVVVAMPPLPTAPRLTSVSGKEDEQTEDVVDKAPALPTVPRPKSVSVEEEDEKPAIPPRSPNVPPAVPPRLPIQQLVVPPTVPPRPH